jgi:thiamine-phosphate pyrophosphorylase
VVRLIVILDEEAARGRELGALASAAARGGATLLQVRGKRLDACALAAAARTVIAAAAQVPVVVNDRLDVALATGAAGCHLGQDDFPIDEARRLAPPGFLLGGSAGNEAEARAAVAQGADYLGIGPVAVTPSKPDAGEAFGIEGFSRIRDAAGEVPSVAIGGVSVSHVLPLIRAGAAGVAVIGAVLGADDPEAATRELRETLDAARW